MKKLVNLPSDVVSEMLEGIARQSPHVAILGDEHVLVRQPLPELYDLRRDIGEAHDLAASRRTLAAELRRTYAAW